MTYEGKINSEQKEGSEIFGKMDISVIRYFWESNPLTRRSRNTIPTFLKDIKIFTNFTENERRILTKFLHYRSFEPNEVIFDQTDQGVGFYLVYSGHVELFRKDSIEDLPKEEIDKNNINEPFVRRHIVLLEKFDYFGELAILQESRLRSACAVAKDQVVLLSIFKPDIEELINSYPIVAAKLLQSISIIVANRFSSVANELKTLKFKLAKYERKE